jgi:hypothetical protein
LSDANTGEIPEFSVCLLSANVNTTSNAISLLGNIINEVEVAEQVPARFPIKLLGKYEYSQDFGDIKVSFFLQLLVDYFQ